jgi:prepilin-type N-terminal cleavage/methylation domain-containing protein
MENREKRTMKNVNRSCRAAFTLVEILVVVAIIALLTGIVTVNLLSQNVKSKMMATQSYIQDLEMAIDIYKTDIGSYPPMDNMVRALEEGLGGNVRWRGPYFSFDSGRFVITQGGLNPNPKNGHLQDENNQVVEPIFLPDNAKVPLDFFNRPIIYIPSRDYRNVPVATDPDTGQPYNRSTFQLISFGFTGKSAGNNPGSLLWNDNIDNDGDGFIDEADNPKSNQKANLTGVAGLSEDDITNF